jgi:hypothetical protein
MSAKTFSGHVEEVRREALLASERVEAPAVRDSFANQARAIRADTARTADEKARDAKLAEVAMRTVEGSIVPSFAPDFSRLADAVDASEWEKLCAEQRKRLDLLGRLAGLGDIEPLQKTSRAKHAALSDLRRKREEVLAEIDKAIEAATRDRNLVDNRISVIEGARRELATSEARLKAFVESGVL